LSASLSVPASRKSSSSFSPRLEPGVVEWIAEPFERAHVDRLRVPVDDSDGGVEADAHLLRLEAVAIDHHLGGAQVVDPLHGDVGAARLALAGGVARLGDLLRAHAAAAAQASASPPARKRVQTPP